MGQQLQGQNTRVWIGLMSAQLTASNSATGLLLPPSDVTVALSGAVTAATAAQNAAKSQTIGVAALSGPIGKGSVLRFVSGTGAALTSRRVTLIAHAKSGDTTLTVAPLVLGIAATAVAQHKGLTFLKGGKKADISIKAEDEETMVFTDKDIGEVDTGSGGFKTGAIKSKSASFPYEALVDPTDIGYSMLANAGASGLAMPVYARVMLAIPDGYATGETYQGLAEVVGWDVTNSAESYVQVKTEIKFRGACERLEAVEAP